LQPACPFSVGRTIPASSVYVGLLEKYHVHLIEVDPMELAFDNLQSLFQDIGDLVFITDLNGNIIDYNVSGKRLLGFSREEVLNRSLTDYWTDESKCRETLSWVMSEASLYVSNLEVCFRKKSGEDVDISLTLSKIKGTNGDVLGVVGVGRDITEKKKIEKAFKSLNQELENFIYTISHDLKSPVLSIEGYTSLLMRDYKERLDEKGWHYLERIQYNIHKMGMLLGDLLELSRSGRVIGELKEIDAGEIIHVILEDLNFQIRQREITVTVANNFPKIWCDRERITQVFENLFTNSIKFMGDQKNPAIDVGCYEREGYHEFFLKDNGIGIDPVYHDKIFGVFQRLEEIPSEGTGVGLTIARRIVENHNGRIWVVSEPGQGATFYFTLPKKPKRFE